MQWVGRYGKTLSDSRGHPPSERSFSNRVSRFRQAIKYGGDAACSPAIPAEPSARADLGFMARRR